MMRTANAKELSDLGQCDGVVWKERMGVIRGGGGVKTKL